MVVAALRTSLLSVALVAGLSLSASAGQDAASSAQKASSKPASSKKASGKKASGKKASGKKASAKKASSNKATGKKAAGDAAPAPVAVVLPGPPAPPPADVPASAPLHRRSRGVSGGLASARQQVKGPTAATRVEKSESNVARAKVATRQRAVAKTPVEELLGELRSQVVSTRPKARGKINVTFRIGRGGVPTNVLIFGFDDKLDVELEKRVAAAKLPASYAGQQISTTLVFRGK